MRMVRDLCNSVWSSARSLPGILPIAALCGVFTLLLPGWSDGQSTDPAGTVGLSIGDYSSVAGSTIAIPVQMVGGSGIAIGEFTLSYDATSLTPVSVETTELTAGFTVADTVKTPGTLGVSLVNTTSISGGSGDLVEVVFEVNGDAPLGQISELELEEAVFYDELGQPFDVETENGEFTVGALRSLVLSVADIAATPGSTISLFLSVDEAAGIAIGELTLAYDATSLTPVSVGTTELTAGFTLVDTVKTPGKLGVSLVNTTAISEGSGDLLEVAFKVSGDAPMGQISGLTLEEVAFFDGFGQPFGTILNDGTFLAEGLSTVSLSIADAASVAGSSLLVPISAMAEEGMGIAGGELVLTYDPDILTPIEVQAAELTPGFIVDFAVNTPGRLAIVLASSAGQDDESGDLVSVEFEVDADAAPGSTSELSLVAASLYDEGTLSLGVEMSGGVFTVLNRAPEAKGDAFTVEEDIPAELAVLDNDMDPDGEAIRIVGVGDPPIGSVAFDASAGTLTYEPSLNYNGLDSFTYTISDAAGATATATVSVTITAVNDPPGVFSRRAPSDGDTVGRETVLFRWETAANVDEDTITYALTIRAGGVEIAFETADTSLSVDLSAAGFPSQELAATWSVHASDGELSAEPADGEGSFTLVRQEPEIEVMPESLAFGEIPIGETLALEVTIGNRGEGDLVVSGISSNSGLFTVLVDPFTLAPAENRVVEVVCAPVFPWEQVGELSIASNDPERAVVNVSLSGHGTGNTVWPGDTNRDGYVNGWDILPIGMHWSRSGPPRPDQSTDWDVHGVAPWTVVPASYADADGNGVVDAGDIVPVAENWRSSMEAPKAMATAGGLGTPEQVEVEILRAMVEALDRAPSAKGAQEVRELLQRAIAAIVLPREFSLLQNAPNPFNASTIIRFAVPADAGSVAATLRIYDAAGRKVCSLVEGEVQPGHYEMRWDGRDDDGRGVASGVFFLHLRAGEFSGVRRMVLLQ